MTHRLFAWASRGLRHAGFPLALMFGLLTACMGQLPPMIPATPTTGVTGPDTPSMGTIVPAPSRVAEVDLLALPAAFRYELTLRPIPANAPATLISGQYRNGAWVQSIRTGEGAMQELLVARDPTTHQFNSYTRAAGDATWTRWPGVTFDAAYGLVSPFTVLRLRSLATQSVITEEGGATRTQALFAAEVVQRVLTAGVLTVADNEEATAALQAQNARFFTPHTVTYWSDSSGKVARAAATLLALGADGQPAPWAELTVAYSGYDDPGIAVALPTSVTDIVEIAGRAAVAEQASEVGPGVNLRVRVFASAGAPATDSVVTAYVAGKQTVADEKLGPDAQFTLKPGLYDVLIRSAGAQQWLKEVVVTQESLASNDVLFEFAQLTVTVVINGVAAAVDMVVYPAGEKTRFAGFSSENPARFRVPVGLYDVEVAAQDGRARKRVEGVEVRVGLETTLTLDLARP